MSRSRTLLLVISLFVSTFPLAGPSRASVSAEVIDASFVSSLATQIRFPEGGPGVVGLAKGDFDKDGKLDLAVATGTNTGGITTYAIELLTGGGEGVFGDPHQIHSGIAPIGGVAAGDTDGDGKTDLVVGIADPPSLLILRGKGDATFTKKTKALQSSPSDVFLADLNGDGKSDVIVRHHGADTVSVALADGDGGFGPSSNHAVGDGPSSVVVVDVDGANGLDVVVGSYEGKRIDSLLNNGAGGFGEAILSDAKAQVTSVSPGDFDEDGKMDLVATGYGPGGNLGFLKGAGDGTFARPESTPDWTRTDGPGIHDYINAEVLDLNQDGNKDVLLAAPVGNHQYALVGLGDGAGAFDLDYWVASPGPGFEGSPLDGAFANSILPGDFDDDGVVDVALGAVDGNGRKGGLSIMLGRSPGVFNAPRSYQTLSGWGAGRRDVALADFTGDGHKDMLAITNTIDIFEGNPDGTFDDPSVLIGPTEAGAKGEIEPADLDKDGYLDLVFEGLGGIQGNDFARHFIAFGGPDGSVADIVRVPLFDQNWRTSDMITEDINNDGYKDLVAVMKTCCGESHAIEIFLNSPTEPRTFTAMPDLLGMGNGKAFSSGSAAVGDFNADGMKDIVARTSSAPEAFLWFEGNGDGTFAEASLAQPGLLDLETPMMRAADVTGDGKLDVLLPAVNSSQIAAGIYLIPGKGNGSFGAARLIGPGYPQSIDVTDMTGDGVLDLAYANYNSSFAVASGKGGGEFAAPVSFAIGARPATTSAVGDLNGDGLPDAVVGHPGDAQNVLTVLMNEPNMSRPDLSITSIAPTQTAVPGKKMSVAYSVTNAGKTLRQGQWVDSVYLSSDATIDQHDPVLGRITRNAPFAAGASYTRTVTVTVPTINPGDYKVIVYTDSRNRIAEADETNIKIAVSEVAVSVPKVAIGASVDGKAAAGDEVFYAIDNPDGATLELALSVERGRLDLYVMDGRLPTVAAHKLRARGPELSKTLAVSAQEHDVLYALLKNPGSSAAPFSLSVDDIPFGARSVDLAVLGDSGPVSLVIEGAGFTVDTGFTLVDAVGGEHPATKAVVTTPTRAIATFDVTGGAHGAADLITTDGQQSATLMDATEIQAGVGRLFYDLQAPEALRAGQIGSWYVTYGNNGRTDVDIPLLLFDLPGAGSLSTTPDGDDLGDGVSILGIPDNPVWTSLRPGEEVTIPLYARVGETGDAVLTAVSPSDPQLADQQIDWASVRSKTDAPDALLDAVRGETGETMLDFFAQALVDLERLAQTSLYESVSLIGGRWKFEEAQITPLVTRPDLGGQADVSAAGAPASVRMKQAPAGDGYQNTHVIIVTDNDYGIAQFPNLEGTSNDGDQMYSYFHDTLGIPNSQITRIKDEVGDGQNIGPQNVLSAIANSGADADDNLVIFNSSHGDTLDRSTPTFGDPRFRYNGGSLSASSLSSALDQKGAGTNFVISDSCYSGNFIQELSSANTVGIAASGTNELSLEANLSGNGEKKGLFAGSFVKRLNEGEDPEDAFKKAKEDVQEKTGAAKDLEIVGTGGTQNPTITNAGLLNGNPWKRPGAIDREIGDTEETVFTGAEAFNLCARDCVKTTTPVVRSIDPNDILGPSGFGKGHYVTGKKLFPYMIRFENRKRATAAAQIVTIKQTLDSDLDPSALELGDFGFGEEFFEVPAGLTSYSESIGLDDGTVLEVEANFDSATRKLLWTFTTVDPATGDAPADPFAGFLPPNKAPPEGEGFVTYRLRARSGLKTDTRINAKARIVFDTNEPIDTPLFRNAIDVTPPKASMARLAKKQKSRRFEVKWSGNDLGSGIARYQIFVSVDGKKFKLWKISRKRKAVYKGKAGHRYAFAARAVDGVGLVERGPLKAETSTST